MFSDGEMPSISLDDQPKIQIPPTEVHVEVTRKQIKKRAKFKEVLNYVRATGNEVAVLKKKGGMVLYIICPPKNEDNDDNIPLDDQPDKKQLVSQ